MSEYFVQPLQGPVEVDFHPAGRVCDGLPAIFLPPALDEADANGAHPCELVDRLKAAVDGLGQLLSKVLVVEDGHVTTYT